MAVTVNKQGLSKFIEKWTGRGKEDEDDRSYWIDLFQNVFGQSDVTDRIDFQKKVIGPDGNTKRIDAYIPETSVIIEQKSLGIALDKPQAGHGGMTPYEQAKMYDNGLPRSEKARWIVTSNFSEIWIYDMEKRKPEESIIKIYLEKLANEYPMLQFLFDPQVEQIRRELKVSQEAGDRIGKVYDALLSLYPGEPTEDDYKSLNLFCVRLVFCYYAEDAGLFGKYQFRDYMASFNPKHLRNGLRDLFRILDTKEEERDRTEEQELLDFPYVNGGLFADHNIVIPQIDEKTQELLTETSDFNWSEISPTIFGAVFESTLNQETRRKGGMHYTSIENIHKVIDPLFLDDLKDEFKSLCEYKQPNVKRTKLREFQNKLGSLKFFDPACGSGNFLTETYLSLRQLENDIIAELNQFDREIADINHNPIKVKLSQFYGIEINDFAVAVAKTALWIAENQMMKKTKDLLFGAENLTFLPLKSYVNIIEGNALQIDWKTIIEPDQCSFIMGNPPYVGFRWATEGQKNDLDNALRHSIKRSKLDFVTGWFYLASEYMQGTKIRTAFLSTNSIIQGEHVAVFWNHILPKFGIVFNFAHTTFEWKNESTEQAHVHCVIIGFSTYKTEKTILYEDGVPRIVKSISPYLTDAPEIVIQKQSKPICDVPQLVPGCQASDGGGFMFTAEEKKELMKKEPNSVSMLKRFMMGYEFLNNVERYCIWIPDKELIDLGSNPIIKERIRSVVEFRKKSTNAQIREKANTPTRFDQFRPPTSQYIAFARVSSQRRKYIPIGFLTDDVIPGDKLFTIPNGTIYMFGVLSSIVHAAWLRVTGGRLKSDYSYSSQMVYNTFPWPDVSPDTKNVIEQTAKNILEAREAYSDKYSLAQMYDPEDMPLTLRKAHEANDKAVMKAYGFNTDMEESEIVGELMKMYQALTENK